MMTRLMKTDSSSNHSKKYSDKELKTSKSEIKGMLVNKTGQCIMSTQVKTQSSKHSDTTEDAAEEAKIGDIGINPVSPRCSERLKRKSEDVKLGRSRKKRNEDFLYTEDMYRDKNKRKSAKQSLFLETKRKDVNMEFNKDLHLMSRDINKNKNDFIQNENLINIQSCTTFRESNDSQNKEFQITDNTQSCSRVEERMCIQKEESRNEERKDEKETVSSEIGLDHTYQSSLNKRAKTRIITVNESLGLASNCGVISDDICNRSNDVGEISFVKNQSRGQGHTYKNISDEENAKSDSGNLDSTNNATVAQVIADNYLTSDVGENDVQNVGSKGCRLIEDRSVEMNMQVSSAVPQTVSVGQELQQMKSLLWTGNDVLSKMIKFEARPSHLLELDKSTLSSVSDKVDSIVVLMPNGEIEDFALQSNSVGQSGCSSIDSGSALTSPQSLVNEASHGGAIYTRQIVDREIENDVIFGPVSAVIKQSFTTSELQEIVQKTGVNMTNTENNVVIQGSWKSLNRAFDMISKKIQEKKVEFTSEFNDILVDINEQEISKDEPVVTPRNSPVSEENVQITSHDARHSNGTMDIESSVIIEADKTVGMNSDDSKMDSRVTSCDKAAGTQIEEKLAQFNCDQCDRTFWTQALLQSHLEQKHGPCKCHLCGKEFACKRYLQMHVKRHDNLRRFECEICGWKFMERHKLKLHLESHKSAEDRSLPYKCDVCQKQFYNKAGWSDHMNTHTGNRPFKCHICDASFAHRIGLRRHLVVHSKTKPFLCLHCNKGFPFKAKLDAHLTMHTGLSRHSCPLCGKIFTVSSSLKRHLESCQQKKADNIVYVNEEQLNQSTLDMIHATVSDPEAVYMCGICGSMFDSLEKAGSHTATHEQSGDIQDQVIGPAEYQEITSANDSMDEDEKSCHILQTSVLPNL